ncbi:MAG: hypothetical protein MJK04_24785 [Psychrosphaera sp.]|nr:hypothetical protein [Psychrosphaera sp.]
MTNQAPQLDTRTTKQLVEQAKNLIPQFTPEWTNLNDSDPGMTLIKVHAWMTETLLYQINNLPQQNYDKFIDLLGVKAKLATSATTDLAFALKKTLGGEGQPLVVNVPLGAKVEVDDPELETPIIFETDRTLSAVNAAIGAIIVPHAEQGDYSLKTEYNAKKAQVTVIAPFLPFVKDGADTKGMYVGLVLRPHQDLKNAAQYAADRWPECEINLTVSKVQGDTRYVDDAALLGDGLDDGLSVENGIQWSYYSGDIETNNIEEEQWTDL